MRICEAVSGGGESLSCRRRISWEDSNFVIPSECKDARKLVEEVADVPLIKNLGVLREKPPLLGFDFFKPNPKSRLDDGLNDQIHEDSISDILVCLSEATTRDLRAQKVHEAYLIESRRAIVDSNNRCFELFCEVESWNAQIAVIGEQLKEVDEHNKYLFGENEDLKNVNKQLRVIKSQLKEEREAWPVEKETRNKEVSTLKLELEIASASRQEAEYELAHMNVDFSEEAMVAIQEQTKFS